MSKDSTTLHIKNMVCNRCIWLVQDVLVELKHEFISVTLGKASLKNILNEEKIELIASKLKEKGFELVSDKKSTLVEKIKTIIINQIHHTPPRERANNYSLVLSERLAVDYCTLSRIFSRVEGVTIEKYIIHQKIEKVKELLSYGELSLGEIAYQLGYRSVQHLSGQFKKIMGATPSAFKQSKTDKRIPLDKI